MISDFTERLNRVIGDPDLRVGEPSAARIDAYYAKRGIDGTAMALAAKSYLALAGITDLDTMAAAVSLAGRFLEVGIQIGREQTEARLS